MLPLLPRRKLPSRLLPRRGRLRRVLSAMGIATGLAVACWQLLPGAYPIPGPLVEGPAPSPLLLDRHGAVLDDAPRLDYFRHKPVTLDAIPTDLVAATLAAEDKRFYRHGGADYAATLRAVYQSIDQRRFVSGASTITQQLVKITSPPADRNFSTKFREIQTARHLEARWTKDEILAAYLNHLDYGSHRQGCAEAAAHFFGKPLADLSLAECALLAGLPQAPSRLNPFRNRDGAVKRRDWVLRRLRDHFGADPERIASALREPLQLRSARSPTPAPHLAAAFRADPAYRDGGAVRTTLDGSLQRQVNRIVRDELERLEDHNVQQAAVVVLHNPTGEIRALLGSPDFHHPAGGKINGALAPRSAGSTLKPFTYLLAMERAGLYPGSIIADIPTRFQTAEGLDAPENFDHRHYGPVTIRRALANSLNISAMRTLNRSGGAARLHSFLRELGLTTLDRAPSEYGLGLTIGNAEVSLLELTNAYATLARLGSHRETRLQFPESIPPPARPATPESCFLIADILSDNAARSNAFGPRSPLRLPFPCAVKTGTSSDFRDNWCIGFTAEFTVGVWVGNFDNTPMRGISGVSGAGPIFHHTMRAIHAIHPPQWLERPSSLVALTVDSRTGKRFLRPPAPGTPNTARELCQNDRLPLPVSPSDYDPRGRALLDSRYEEWFAGPDNLQRHRFAMASLPAPEVLLQITSPPPDATYLLDPELPNQGTHLPLASNVPGEAIWESATLALHGESARLVPGTHTITLLHPRTGRRISRTITVESL